MKLGFAASRVRLTAGVAGLMLAASGAVAATPDTDAPTIEQMRAQFKSPPAEARPMTWFHVMSGNMSREGITKDLEAMAEAGIGGIVLFHVTQGIPHGTVRFNSPEHLDLIAHVAAECERLGLLFNFHNADGWSSSGGPWITPEQSMKRIVWSQAIIAGGRVNAKLARPVSRANLYEDIAVIAYPALPTEKIDATLSPSVTASDPGFAVDLATDGNRETRAILPASKEQPGWVQFTYDDPVTIRSLLLENSPTRGLVASLEKSDDGMTWESVKTFKTRRIGKFEWMVDDAFAGVTARYFRVSTAAEIEFGELILSAVPRIPDVTLHTSMAQGAGTQLPEQLDSAAGTLIDPAQIIDLSGSLDDAGNLTAILPSGDWTVLRFGYTSTGATNVIASPEGTGFEVDKFAPAAFKAHYDGFIGPVLNRARAVAPSATNGVMIDSYEVGGQNWTSGYEDLFAEKFGQSIIPWLPIYTGRLVSSAKETRDMLAGIRSFNADLIRDNYYGVFAEMMESQGLESYVQPYGMGPSDDVDIGSTASVPTGEFWMGREVAQLNDAVSAGRLYAKKMIAAEAFTAFASINWHFSPALGKKWGDRAWVNGINQFMFHRFAHQANTHVMPGMTMNRYGSHFDRTQPWWDKGGKAWFEYMARGHYMLRQGLPVVDIAMYVGEDSPVSCPEKKNLADSLPAGTEFDCLNEESLLSRSRFVDGKMVLPNGQSYSMIWWPQNRAPGKAALARMQAAREAGVPVAMRHEGDDAKAVFAMEGLTARVSSAGPLPLFTQRKVGDIDVFFLLNLGEETAEYDLSFDVSGRAPALWDPVTGAVRPMPAKLEAGGRTGVQIDLLAGQSAFLVFDPGNAFAAPQAVANTLEKELTGPWSIAFDPLYSDTIPFEAPALFDLRSSKNTEIRHFSGKARYQHTFNWSGGGAAKTGRLLLDLGQVEVVASVTLNGVDLGTLWTPPYTLDATKAVRSGENVLEIEIANLWVNRLIGDAGLEDTSGFVVAEHWPNNNMVKWYSDNEPLPPGPRRTFSTQSFFKNDDPLVPSGLIGPVQLLRESAIE
ncbi:glycoside hydrolase [Erythrobacter insulae]|uniref:Glycoside hydrolase n=1 Tax=Erythrobacter insulae TaxID=2584124 RepID=A0A547PD74_9SPHN|nr:glycosyl hydrolase [Erythrobacter insulae]TRD12079.1 glycoside hydrolase [Erythrobacter insulae]